MIALFSILLFVYGLRFVIHFFFIYKNMIRISRLKFAKFYEYFKYKAEAEILERIDKIL